MKRWIAAWAMVVCSVAPGWAFKRVHVGEPHRDFALEDLEGTRVHLAEALGAEATLVVFWAGWSPRSSEALLDYQKLYDAHRDDGLQVVAVDVAHQEWHSSELPGVQKFVAERGLEYPVVIDRDLSVFNDYGVIAVPSTALLDGAGKIVALLEGYATTTRDGFRDRILETLGVKQAAPVVTEAPDAYRPKGKAERYFRMAEILIEREMPRKAVHILKRSIREDPDWPEPYRVLAEVFEREGRADEAAEARARYAELTGIATSAPGETVDAPVRAKAQPVARPSPAAHAAAARYLRMGALFLGKGMPTQAEKSFRKALKKNPASPEVHVKLAEALEAQGKTDEAASERARAEKLAQAQDPVPVGGSVPAGGQGGGGASLPSKTEPDTAAEGGAAAGESAPAGGDEVETRVPAPPAPPDDSAAPLEVERKEKP